MLDGKVSQNFRNAWAATTSSGPGAQWARDVREVDYPTFRMQLERADETFAAELVESIRSGDVYVLRNAFDPPALKQLRARAFQHGRTTPVSGTASPKMVDGCPDSHIVRNWHSEDAGGYSSTSRLFHMFRWNGDPLGLFPLFGDLYRTMKVVSGLAPEAFEKNVPSDGTIDRIEVAHYPRGVGGIGFHTDPIGNIRFMCTVTLTEFGVDYRRGGFAVGGPNGRIRPVEPAAPLGSIVGFFPSICHGVEVIDPDMAPDWEGNSGRWYVGLSCVDSQAVRNRAITLPVPGFPTLREQVAKSQPRASAR